MSKNRGRRPQYYLMPLGMLLQSFIPRWLALRIAWLLVGLAFPLLKEQRAVIMQNFRRILGRELKPGEGDAISRRLLHNLATCTADLLRGPLLRKGCRLEQLVPFQDYRAQLDAVLAPGRGAVLVTCHCGNWDLAGVFVAAMGYPIVAVFERITQGMSDVFNRFRGTSGMELVGLDDRRGMDRALEAGKLFVLLGDRDLKGTGQELPWFSGRRRFPRGAAAFSLRYKVPLVTAYFVLEPGDTRHRYRVKVEPPIEFKPSGDFYADVDALTALLVKRLERIVSVYPDQWFVFQPRWLES